MEREVRELKKQRDLDHSRIVDLIRAARSVNGDLRCNGTSDPLLSENSEDHSSEGTEETPLRSEEDCDDICKDVRCIEMDESGQDRTYESFGVSTKEDGEMMQTSTGNGHAVEDVSFPGSASTSVTGSRSFILTRSRSCRANLMTRSPDFEMAEQSERTPPSVLDKDFVGRPESGFFRKQWKLPPMTHGTKNAKLTRNDSQHSDCSSLIDEMKNQNSTHGDEDIPTLGSFVAGLREMAKLQVRDFISLSSPSSYRFSLVSFFSYIVYYFCFTYEEVFFSSLGDFITSLRFSVGSGDRKGR